MVTKIVLQRWTRLAFATELIFIVVYTLDVSWGDKFERMNPQKNP